MARKYQPPWNSSGWLSLATAWALNLWAEICAEENAAALADEFNAAAGEINQAVNQHLWDGQWFGRGITDDGAVFGVSKDKEGRIFLTSTRLAGRVWLRVAILCATTHREHIDLVLESIREHSAKA